MTRMKTMLFAQSEGVDRGSVEDSLMVALHYSGILQVVSTELPKMDHLLKEVSPNRPSSNCLRLSARIADHTMRCVMLLSYG